MAVAGVGISHDELADHTAAFLAPEPKYFETKTKDYDDCVDPFAANLIKPYTEHHVNAAVHDSPARYGGGELYEQTVDTMAYVAVAVEGAGLKNPKDALALALLQQVILISAR